MIQNKPKRSHVTDLYKSYNLFPLDSLYNQQLLLIGIQVLYTYLIPPIFCEYFLRNSQIHSHSTRTQNNLHILAPNTSFKKRTVKYKCSVLWNSLPDHMKTCSSVAAFKRARSFFISICVMMIRADLNSYIFGSGMNWWCISLRRTLWLFSLLFFSLFLLCMCVYWAASIWWGFRLSGSPPCVSILVLYVILIDYGK